MSEICEYCKKGFVNKFVLKNHLKTAKFCIQIRYPHGIENEHVCQYCEKAFTIKFNLEKHESKCIYSKFHVDKLQKTINDYKFEIEKLKIENHFLKKLSEIKDVAIEKSENRTQELALVAVKKPTTNNKNIINNMAPITQEWLKSQAEFLTPSHVEEGAKGYASFAIDYSLKDRVQVSDISRSIVQYKDEKGASVKEKGHHLSKLFFQSIKEKNKNISDELKKKIFDQIDKTKNQEELDLLFTLCTQYVNNMHGVNSICEGGDHELKNEFIKELFKKLSKTAKIDSNIT